MLVPIIPTTRKSGIARYSCHEPKEYEESIIHGRRNQCNRRSSEGSGSRQKRLAANTPETTEASDAGASGAKVANVAPDTGSAEQAPAGQKIAAVEPKIDEHGRSYATGKRKDTVARVWIKPGSGKIEVNGRDVETYFARPVLRMILAQPFEAAERKNQYDVKCTVKGGGLSGQAGAVRHGIFKALTLYEPSLPPGSEVWGVSHERLAGCREEKIRSPQGPSKLPVLKALVVASFMINKTSVYCGFFSDTFR